MSSTITVTGNLTRDPELRYTDGGMEVVKFGLAETYRSLRGDNQEVTSYYNVVAFRSTARNIMDTLTKGARVIVTGRQEVREFERNDGTRGHVTEIIADEVGASLLFATAEISRNAPRADAPQQSAPKPKRPSAPARNAEDEYESF